MEQLHPVVYSVDDDLAVCSVLRRLIQWVWKRKSSHPRATFSTRSTSTARGCVVLDIRLPDLSGLNLQEKLADANIDLPTIFITGFGDIPMTVRAVKAGALEFLTKPIHEQQLLDAMQRGIENIEGS